MKKKLLLSFCLWQWQELCWQAAAEVLMEDRTALRNQPEVLQKVQLLLQEKRRRVQISAV